VLYLFPGRLSIMRLLNEHRRLIVVSPAASDAPSTGLEDIQVDVRSKFEMFENFKENNEDNNMTPIKR
jgi:hypothetical protein